MRLEDDKDHVVKVAPLFLSRYIVDKKEDYSSNLAA